MKAKTLRQINALAITASLFGAAFLSWSLVRQLIRGRELAGLVETLLLLLGYILLVGGFGEAYRARQWIRDRYLVASLVLIGLAVLL